MRFLHHAVPVALVALLPFVSCQSPTESEIAAEPASPVAVTWVETEVEPELAVCDFESGENDAWMTTGDSAETLASAAVAVEPEMIQLHWIEETPEMSPDFGAAWVERAAREGSMEAQLAFGLRLRSEADSDDELEQAATWLEMAAAQGSSAAQCELGLMYLDGHGVAASDEVAADWFQCSAEQGNPIAQHNLGVLYASGRGVERNLPSASAWFKCASENGIPQSHGGLGRLGEQGSMSENDLVSAYHQYLIAKQLGHDDATGQIESSDSRLGEDENREILSRSEQWMSKND